MGPAQQWRMRMQNGYLRPLRTARSLRSPFHIDWLVAALHCTAGSTSELQDVLNTSPGNAAYIPSRLGQQTGPASLPSPASTTGLRAYGRATLGQGQGGGARVARVSRRLALLMDITATYRSQVRAGMFSIGTM
jgi:hypothetical protein